MVAPAPHREESACHAHQAEAGAGVVEGREAVPLLRHVVQHRHAVQEPAAGIIQHKFR